MDKTDILYELIEETNNEVTLFTRPRRFGKLLSFVGRTDFDVTDKFETLLNGGTVLRIDIGRRELAWNFL